MPTNVSISDGPSTDGATQSRSVGISLSTPDTGGSYETDLTLSVDATQNGSFRELRSFSATYSADTNTSVTLRPFIGVKPTYDLRVTATFTPTSGTADAVTRRDAITVIDEDDVPSVDDISPNDFDLNNETAAVRGGDPTDVTPRIGPVEPIVLSAEYQLPWDRDNNQTACGQSIQTQNGDFNWRIVFNGVLTLSQVDQLRALRNNASAVETRSAVFGVREVDFDQLSLTRPESPSAIQVDGEVQPIVEFQLQTKELDEQGSNGLFGGTQ